MSPLGDKKGFVGCPEGGEEVGGLNPAALTRLLRLEAGGLNLRLLIPYGP